MARLWTAGAELRTTSAVTDPDGIVTGTNAIDTTFVRSGSASYRHFGSPGLAFGKVDLATTGGLTMVVNPTNIDVIANGVTVASGVGTITSDTWIRIELSVTTNGSSQFASYDALIDGVSVASGSFTAFAPTNQFAYMGANTTNFRSWAVTFAASTTYYSRAYIYKDTAGGLWYSDDFGVNDSTGGNQNSWLGSGKVVLLKPSTDSAVGTGWTLGTGTAIAGNSGATAVKNTPPQGVADLTAGSDTKQIRNASSATADYDTGLDSYTTAGIASGDTINLVVPFISTGAPSATGAKSGNLVLVSNPAGATDSHGNYRGSANAGTWPTGWKWTVGTPQYAPTVTLATSPVLRSDITSGTASRVAMVCSMGMYVDYTPATKFVPRNPAINHTATALLAKAHSVIGWWSRLRPLPSLRFPLTAIQGKD